jgi:RNA polymerase sigma-70 factor, ECF subfamily
MAADKQKYLSDIYDNYADSIYRFLLLKTNSVDIAQDLTSETFLRFISKIINGGVASDNRAGFDPAKIQNPRAFLYKTAKNLLIDYYRVKNRTVFMENDLGEYGDYKISDKSDSADSIQEVIKNFDIEKEVGNLTEALVKLQSEYAEVIILRYIEEMSFFEIAEIVEKPEGTVRVMLHRGIKELRNIIKNTNNK